MTENTPFNDEWNKLQKAFWDDVGSNFVNFSNSTIDVHSDTKPQHSVLFNQWLSDVDKCWQDHAEITSTEIDTLYKKISSSSRFFINFTESVTSSKQGDTVEVLIEKLLEGLANKTSDNKTNGEDSSQPNKNLFNSMDINAFWKLPLENGRQQAIFFTNQKQSLSTLSRLFEDAANNPEFSAAVEAYLIALQKYQLVFFNLFKASAKQVVETQELNSNEPASPKQFMTVCLEVLEANYMLLISEDSYSQAYANVINSWMLVLSKSNKPFAEFMQEHKSSAQVNPDGQTHVK